MCFVVEIGMLIFGIIALVRGRFTLTRTRVVQGVPARIIGVLLILPLPLALGVGFAIGVTIVAMGKQVNVAEAQKMIGPIEAGIVAVFLLAALITALATAQVPDKRRRLEDEGDYGELADPDRGEHDRSEDFPPRSP